MFSFASLALISHLALLAAATPVPGVMQVAPGNWVDTVSGAQGMTVAQLVGKPGKSGPQAYAAAYRKYKKRVPKNVEKMAEADSKARTLDRRAPQSSVVANPESYDLEYLCPVSVGTPAKVLNLNFDTGSADLWVFSSLQPSSQVTGHDIYNPGASTTSRQVSGSTWNIQYGDGTTANGLVYNDTVTLGSLAVTAQAVEAAQNVDTTFQQDVDADGILGLSFSVLNAITPKPRTTWFETAIAQKKLINNLFTADLKKGRPGAYGFGQIDTTRYTGSITYTPVNKAQGYWGFTSSGYGIGNTFTSSSIAAIVDTGTTLMTLPNTIVSQYWAKVPGAAYDNNYGAYLFPCTAALPTFTVGVGTARYVLPGAYLNYGPVSSTTCYGGLQSSDGMGINIFGDIFIKGVFVVFDFTNNRLGFATKTLT